MKPFWILSLLVLLLMPATGAQAQDLAPLSLKPAVDAEKPQVLHVTDLLMNSPEGLADRAAFRAMKAQGWQPPVNKSTAALGDTMTFKVFSFVLQDFENIDFKLMAESERFLIWVELGELDNGNVEDDILQDIENEMANRTPPGSVDPNAGIIVNDELIFGVPPNVDGDGKSDLLLLDVRDGYDSTQGGSFVAGFITTNDLPGRGGNNRDVLYLDTFPSLGDNRGIDFLGATAAHEYQHLIHLNYDTNEGFFVNEGLSEWAEVALGYEGRTIQYLNNPAQYNVALLNWSGNGNATVLQDYQRGGLFTSYIAERIGVFDTGAITRETADGAQGYRAALTAASASFSLEEMLVDFHIANFLNDINIDPRYGYTAEQRANVRATPTEVFDARVDTETPSTTLSVRSGAVQYYVWEQVTDLSVSLNASSSNIQVTALLSQGNSFEVRPVALGQTSFTGDYDRVVFVIVNTSAGGSATTATVSATWNVEETFSVENIAYDTGQVQDFVLGSGAELLTRFENPAPRFAFLSEVFLPVYYFNQFSNPDVPPPSSPRDFTFNIRSVEADGTPGDILFTLTQDDPRAYAGVTSSNLEFVELDLTDHMAELVNLPNSFFLGYVDPDAGSDSNEIILVNSPYGAENISYLITTAGTVRELWDIALSDGTPLSNTVVPIRAKFLVSSRPVANEDATEVPERIALSPNYPNPFNPTTTIAFALPQSTPVRLTVYDVLGREIAVLVDGVQAAGTHQVQVDARQWSSGTYFYTLEASGQHQTQRMVLIK